MRSITILLAVLTACLFAASSAYAPIRVRLMLDVDSSGDLLWHSIWTPWSWGSAQQAMIAETANANRHLSKIGVFVEVVKFRSPVLDTPASSLDEQFARVASEVPDPKRHGFDLYMRWSGRRMSGLVRHRAAFDRRCSREAYSVVAMTNEQFYWIWSKYFQTQMLRAIALNLGLKSSVIPCSCASPTGRCVTDDYGFDVNQVVLDFPPCTAQYLRQKLGDSGDVCSSGGGRRPPLPPPPPPTPAEAGQDGGEEERRLLW